MAPSESMVPVLSAWALGITSEWNGKMEWEKDQQDREVNMVLEKKFGEKWYQFFKNKIFNAFNSVLFNMLTHIQTHITQNNTTII